MMRLLFLAFLTFLFACSKTDPASPPSAVPPSPSGQEVPNGGEFVSSTFLRKGREVLRYLRNTSAGRTLVSDHGLDVDKLEAILRIENIDVVDAVLFDYRGTVVDATGVPGRIRLDRKRWAEHFDLNRDIHYLVFHEMMRAAAYPDLEFKVSLALADVTIPTEAQTSSSENLPPQYVSFGAYAKLNIRGQIMRGSGCYPHDSNLRIDPTTHSIEMDFNDFNLRRVPVRARLARLTCLSRLQFMTAPGYRLVLRKVTVLGSASTHSSSEAEGELMVSSQFSIGNRTSKRAPILGSPNRLSEFRNEQTDFAPSACGTSGLLALDTAVVWRSLEEELPFFEIDKIVYQFEGQTCAQ